MQILEQTLQVNKLAQKNRHFRVFSRGELIRAQFVHLLSAIVKPFGRFRETSVYAEIGRFLAIIEPLSPQSKLLFQAGVIAVAALVVTSMPQGATFALDSFGYSDEYIAAYSLPGDILVTDQDGYLVKANPQTHSSSRIGLNDYAVHTVASGETLSKIAKEYGVSLETIMWENNLYNPNMLRIGQSLLVPPVNGVSYNVQANDTLEKIAKKYGISVDTVIAQNNLESEIIQKGQKLFLPGARPLQSAVVVRASGASRAGRIAAAPSSAIPAGGKPFIFPTKGKLTQGYRAGHYAFDIADSGKPPVWAAGSGVVEKASSGTWGGGYGNHVIIDHGNGLKTLYAHLGSINVYEGQTVGQGDVVGVMGNTGRVYGKTGIHLHFEVIDNGVKQYPANYY